MQEWRGRDHATGTHATGAADSAAFLAGIDALLPSIRERAGAAEQGGRVPAESIAALTEAGIFRATQPRQWGGLELDHATFYDAAIRIASACPSTGWVASVVGIHPWQIALFPEQGQADVWRADPDARASSSYAPTGKVERVADGFLLSGRWHFSSGVDHCSWVMLGGVVAEDAHGPAEFRTFLVPRADFAIDHASWAVTGLAGTGSKDVLLAGAVVPEHRTHRITDVHRGTDPGLAVNGRPYFRLNWRLAFAATIAAPAIGAALGAVEAFVAQNRQRVSSYGGPSVARNPALYRPLAAARVEVASARARMRAAWTEMTAAEEAGAPVPYGERVRYLYEFAHAHETCSAAVFALQALGGGRTMRADNPFQRFLRDLMAMRNHPAADIGFAATLYAQAQLGLPPAPFVPTSRVVL